MVILINTANYKIQYMVKTEVCKHACLKQSCKLDSVSWEFPLQTLHLVQMRFLNAKSTQYFYVDNDGCIWIIRVQ